MRRSSDPRQAWASGVAPEASQEAPAGDPERAETPWWHLMVSDDADGYYARAAEAAAKARYGAFSQSELTKRKAHRLAMNLYNLRHAGVHACNLQAIAAGRLPWPRG